MSYEDDRGGLALSADTREKLRELFDGRVCARCGDPAVRLTAADRYFCAAHYHQGQARSAAGPRVYRCTAPAE